MARFCGAFCAVIAIVFLTAVAPPVSAELAMLIGTGPRIGTEQEPASASCVYAFRASDGQYMGALLCVGGQPSTGAYGIAVGRNGDVYVSSYFTNEVIRWRKSTSSAVAIDVSAHVSGPSGLAFGVGANNYLYVASSQTGEILKYDAEGNYVGVFASDIANVSGLEFCANGNLYAAQAGTPGPTADSALLRFNAAGTARWDFDTGIELNDPWGMASYDAEQPYIYVASRESNAVLRYIRSTRVLDISWGLKTADGGAPFTGLSSPACALCDSEGNLYVSDWGNDRILRFNAATGVYIGAWASVESPLYMRFAVVGEPGGVAALAAGLSGLAGALWRRRIRGDSYGIW